MTRIASILFFLTAAGAALFLFHIKQEVREMEEELGIVHHKILRHQEAIQVLRTEWSYLNRPARIAELAERHLDMQPLVARQFVGFEEIPYRAAAATLPAPAQAGTQTTPTLTAPTLTAPTLTATAQTAAAGGAAQ
jgi:cell division protein FtsL